MAPSHLGETRRLSTDRLGRDYRRYRLPDPEAEADMAGSLRRYGQLTPLVVCLREETYEGSHWLPSFAVYLLTGRGLA